MQRSIREQGWVMQHPSSSDSAKYGAARPSTRPPSYICTNQLWFRQQSTQLIHGREQQEVHMLDVFHRRCLRTILGISWRDHITNGELMKRARMEDLSNIVRREDWHWQGIYCGYHQTDQQVRLCSGYLMEAGEEEDVQGRPGDKHSSKIYRRCESAGVVFVEWAVITELVKKCRRPMFQQQ